MGLVLPLGPLGLRAMPIGSVRRRRCRRRRLRDRPRRPRARAQGGDVRAPRVRGLLGIPARRRAVHVAAASGVERRRAARRGGPAHRHRLAVRTGGRDDDEVRKGNMFVPIDVLTPILDDLVTTGRAARPPRPWLGMYASEDDHRLVVGGLAQGGPAERAGVRQGDLIVAVGGSARGQSRRALPQRCGKLGPSGHGDSAHACARRRDGTGESAVGRSRRLSEETVAAVAGDRARLTPCPQVRGASLGSGFARRDIA